MDNVLTASCVQNGWVTSLATSMEKYEQPPIHQPTKHFRAHSALAATTAMSMTMTMLTLALFRPQPQHAPVRQP